MEKDYFRIKELNGKFIIEEKRRQKKWYDCLLIFEPSYIWVESYTKRSLNDVICGKPLTVESYDSLELATKAILEFTKKPKYHYL